MLESGLILNIKQNNGSKIADTILLETYFQSLLKIA